jgi:hypothetical protein
MPETPNKTASKREKTTRLGLWLVFALASQASVMGLVVLMMTWAKVDVTPVAIILSSVTTVLLTGIGAMAAKSLGYNTADTLRPSGEAKGSWVRETPPPDL